MNGGLPDPKTLVDSIGDGVAELVQLPMRLTAVAGHRIEVAGTEAQGVVRMLTEALPDRPEVIPNAVVLLGKNSINGVLSSVEEIVGAFGATAKGVQGQIRRVLR